jgi:hypothetical protein
MYYIYKKKEVKKKILATGYSILDVWACAYHDLFEKINLLGKKLNFFIEAVKKEHISVK